MDDGPGPWASGLKGGSEMVGCVGHRDVHWSKISFQTEQGTLNVQGVTEEATAKRKVVGCDQMRPRPRRGMLLMRLSRQPWPLKTETHIKRLKTHRMYTCSNLQSDKFCSSKPQSIGHKERERFLSFTLLRVQRRQWHKQYKGQLFGVCVTVYGVSKTEKGVFCGLYTWVSHNAALCYKFQPEKSYGLCSWVHG